MSKQKLSKEEESPPVDEEVEALMKRAKEIKTIIEDESKKVLDELEMTPAELHELFENIEAIDDEHRELVIQTKESVKEELEKIFGAEEYKSIMESAEKQKKDKSRKKAVSKSKRKWIDMH